MLVMGESMHVLEYMGSFHLLTFAVNVKLFSKSKILKKNIDFFLSKFTVNSSPPY